MALVLWIRDCIENLVFYIDPTGDRNRDLRELHLKTGLPLEIDETSKNVLI